jgi:hypothetical protein
VLVDQDAPCHDDTLDKPAVGGMAFAEGFGVGFIQAGKWSTAIRV